MSDDPPSNGDRQELPDELPRSVVSDEARHSDLGDREGAPGRILLWLIFGIVVVVAFLALLWLGGGSRQIGKPSGVDVVAPAAPPVRPPT